MIHMVELSNNPFNMLQTCSSRGSRCARRILVFVFVWSFIMIAALQFRQSVNEVLQHNSLGADVNYPSTGTWSSDQPSSLSSSSSSSSSSSLLLASSSSSSIKDLAKGFFPTPNDFSHHSASPILDNERVKKLNDKQLLLDKRPPRTEQELVKEIESRLPSLPLAYWMKSSNFKSTSSNDTKAKKSCIPRYPSIFELEFNNIYWQTFKSSNGTFQLYGAYYDNRKLSKIGPAIRIIGMIDRIEPKVKTYCQLWFDKEKEPQIVDVLEYKYIWYSKWGNYKQGIYQPYVIACKIPQTHWAKSPPASVSIVEKPCDTASTNLRVIYNKPEKKKEFAVCVKGLDFLHEDLSVRLVEWIELISILGADKIFFYQLQVHPNITKVLDYYSQLGRVQVTPLTLPGGQPNIPAFQHMYLKKKTNHKRQNELIPYNDCLYKHMYEYEYIVLLDIDEVIMPVQDSTWSELMQRVLPKAFKIRNETRASYNVRNVYFLDDLLHSHGFFDHVPRYMHMLQHVYRSMNFTKPNEYIKCFHNPERIVTLHNHFPLACLGAGCTSYPIETEDAQLQHYRADCVTSLKKTCLQYRKNSIVDTTIWRYKDQLVERVTDTLVKLGFFGPG
ncbi:uncharacterized protein [Chelonus insularis]|uniref:uncharacterized protein n=1 Tax=Chelonus insularis TaxID=460826 RepID=UPI00158A057E|nr:uncharacterized protein LOC118069400 [Chelonus insularis]XP_034943380.1 uncharacterized protein LOC118069400 [Chelonus insularis]